MSVLGSPRTDRDATFVNDTPLATGVPAGHRGDILRLGHVALTFWDPSA